MANDKQRRMMQEALDDVLSHEERNALLTLLDKDAETSAEYNRLQKLDRLLRTAPHERAPQRLAATIMARLAEGVKQEAEAQLSLATDPQAQQATREMIALALALSTVVTMPLMVGASWLILNAMASPQLLNAIFEQVIAVMLLLIEVMKVFVEQAQLIMQSDPASAMALLALIPATLFEIAHYIIGDDSAGDVEGD